MEYLMVPAKTEELDRVYDFVEGQLESFDCPMRTLFQLRLAIEEIFINIASYAYAPKEGEAEVCCTVLENPLRVELQFLDGGTPFDPLAREEADTSPEGLMNREGGPGYPPGEEDHGRGGIRLRGRKERTDHTEKPVSTADNAPI